MFGMVSNSSSGMGRSICSFFGICLKNIIHNIYILIILWPNCEGAGEGEHFRIYGHWPGAKCIK
jgi:hypothetical protein